MNKNRLIYCFCLLLGTVLFMSSCDDNKNDNLTPTTVYIVGSGVQPLKIYNKGSGTTYTYSLDLYRAGAICHETLVKIALLTADELKAYNLENNTEYELLSQNAYSIDRFEALFSSDKKDVNQLINITFDPAKMDVSETNKVVPVKIIESSSNINKEKSVCIIHPQSNNPIFSLEFPQEKVISYKQRQQAVMSFDISVLLDIDKNDSDIDLEIEIDEDYIKRYNQANNEDYTLPVASNFSIEKNMTMKAGSKSVSFNLKVFQQYLTKYNMLPIRLKSSSKYHVNPDTYYVLMLNVQSELLPTAGWSIVGFSSEEATGESGGANGKAIYIIDGNKNTYWHSQWQGSIAPLPHYLTIDMKQSFTISQIDMYQRQTSLVEVQTKACQFFISEDNINWSLLGNFSAQKTRDLLSFPVKKGKGRYLKVVVTESYFNNGVGSIGEIIPRGY